MHILAYMFLLCAVITMATGNWAAAGVSLVLTLLLWVGGRTTAPEDGR